MSVCVPVLACFELFDLEKHLYSISILFEYHGHGLKVEVKLGKMSYFIHSNYVLEFGCIPVSRV